MDELELRLATLELLALERLALDSPARLVALEANIAAGLRVAVDEDERVVRQAALETLDLARRRFDEFIHGAIIPKSLGDS